MATFKVKVVQTYKAERRTTIDVEAVDQESAIEQVKSWAVDVPTFEDRRWVTSWIGLEDETITKG